MSFSNTWHNGRIYLWEKFIIPKFSKKNDLNYLEIGSYEGNSLSWMFNNVLTGNNCNAVSIDTFEGSIEHDLNFEKNTL